MKLPSKFFGKDKNEEQRSTPNIEINSDKNWNKTELIMKLPEDWIAVETGHKSSFLDELKKEVAPGHKLFNVELTVVAYKDETDDILCRYDNEPDRYCLVHLTWLGRQESDTVFPFVEFNGDFKSFLAFDAVSREL